MTEEEVRLNRASLRMALDQRDHPEFSPFYIGREKNYRQDEFIDRTLGLQPKRTLETPL